MFFVVYSWHFLQVSVLQYLFYTVDCLDVQYSIKHGTMLHGRSVKIYFIDLPCFSINHTGCAMFSASCEDHHITWIHLRSYTVLCSFKYGCLNVYCWELVKPVPEGYCRNLLNVVVALGYHAECMEVPLFLLLMCPCFSIVYDSTSKVKAWSYYEWHKSRVSFVTWCYRSIYFALSYHTSLLLITPNNRWGTVSRVYRFSNHR